MKVKKYTAPTMPEAMKTVRKELGDSAVILNSKEKRTKGFLGLFKKKNIEVVAAVDPTPVKPSTQEGDIKEPNLNFKLNKQSSLNLHQPQQQSSVTTDQDLLKEIRELRESLMQSSSSTTSYPAPLEAVAKQLHEEGVAETHVHQLMEPAMSEYYTSDKQADEADYWEIVKRQITEDMQEAIEYEQKQSVKKVFLFGPTGVGKTTTLAKLAADASINRGLDVALITLDTYRIAAVEQLKTYAKILDLPVEVAYNQDDFVKAKEQFADKDLILIDTAGRNFRHDQYIDEVKQFVQFEDDDELFVVLSLTAKEQDIDDIYTRFHDLYISQVIFTKLDETKHFGSILNLWRKHQFKIAYLTNGQDVPDDIERPSAQQMTDLIVGDRT
ncbi:flagellar biosynthesis protein FlhF [Alkalibacillus flavidus]|uniref:Flagellar biosynthesis protein FlhF n=1 Tax=Alkalibacillus flavidus TaxID=546021 RepID=A0ABV2KRC9_9BACI